MTDRKIRIAEVFGDNETLTADQLAKVSSVRAEGVAHFFDGHLKSLLQIERSADRRNNLIGQRSALRGLAHVAVELGLADRHSSLTGHRFDEVRFPSSPAMRPIAMMQTQNANRFSIDSNRGSQD
jgi:hypothetical protein